MRSLLVVVAVTLSTCAHGKVIHSERSLYQNILVTEVDGRRCLQFSVRRDQRNQSCKDLDHPERLVFTYTRMMLASLLVNVEPKTILIVGLGGGSLPDALSRLYPEAAIDIVEIDPAVVRVAADYFDFRPTARMRIFEQDARVWGKRALRDAVRYDLILLDAFNGDYIPEHLMTKEYLEETRQLLTAAGAVAANTFAISDLYDHESVTYEAVFGPFLNLLLPDSANRIIIASRSPLPDRATLEARAERLAPSLARLDVPIEHYPSRLSTARDWRPDARLLSDQYAPANLLRSRGTR